MGNVDNKNSFSLCEPIFNVYLQSILKKILIYFPCASQESDLSMHAEF